MNTRELTLSAAGRLRSAPQQKRIVLIYAGILTGLAALTTLSIFLLDLQINKTGGLSSLGTRSILSSIQTMLPIFQVLVSLCLGLGYRAAMLRIARKQYASPQTLRLGLDRFWVLVRATLLKGLILFSVGFVSIYMATMIFFMTPLFQPVMEILAPVLENASALNPNLVLDENLYAQLMPAMTPVMAIFAVLFCVLAYPVAMRYRMVDYVLIDKPGTGAFAAMRASRLMMRGNFKNLLKVDLSLWWYYAALVGASLLCYAERLLPLIGVELAMSGVAAYYLFYALYLAVQFAIYYFLCNQAEVTYALAYEAVRPEEKKPEGVVLGNIFQM